MPRGYPDSAEPEEKSGKLLLTFWGTPQTRRRAFYLSSLFAIPKGDVYSNAIVAYANAMKVDLSVLDQYKDLSTRPKTRGRYSYANKAHRKDGSITLDKQETKEFDERVNLPV